MTVSVIIPAYNVAGIVRRAIQSALDQTVTPLEILVIDDCSTDDTAATVRAVGSPLVRLLSTPKNGGPSAARNVGLSHARGEWLALLDADDVWKPDYIERLAAVGESTAADIVLLNVILWDNIADREVRPGLTPGDPVRKITIRDLYENDSIDFKFFSFSWGTLKAIFRRSFIARHGIRYDETLRMGEDFEFYAECLFKGAQAFLISEPYYIYSMPTPPSGKSPYSQTRYDFAALISKCDAVSRQYADRIDADLASAISRRRRVIELIHQANIARGYRRSRQFARYAWYIGTKPELLRNLFVRGLHNLSERRLREWA